MPTFERGRALVATAWLGGRRLWLEAPIRAARAARSHTPIAWACARCIGRAARSRRPRNEGATRESCARPRDAWRRASAGARAAVPARSRGPHWAGGAPSQPAGRGNPTRVVCAPAKRMATRVCGDACGRAPRAIKDVRQPTRSRGPHWLGAPRAARARALPRARGATAARGQRGPRARARRGVRRVPSRASMCASDMCAATRTLSLAARPHASRARASPPTKAARAPLYRSAMQWCRGARAMRVRARAVTHCHHGQISACGKGPRTTTLSCARSYRCHLMCMRGCAKGG
jgi:hypothetical protein